MIGHCSRVHRGTWLASCLFVLAPALSAQIKFTDVSDSVGFSGTLTGSGNIHGLGVCWLDFDNDGSQDLFVVNGKGYVKELYRNLNDGSFDLRNDLLPSLPDVEFMGAIAGDYDNDGDTDLYVFTDHEILNMQGPPIEGPLNLLLQNQWVENGGGLSTPLFVEVAAAAGVEDRADPPLGPDYDGYQCAIGSFLDFDRDGLLDIYVGKWAMGATDGHIADQDVLFRNLGDGTFVDVAEEAGLPQADTDPDLMRSTLGFIAADLNGDLWPDLYCGHTGMENNAEHADDHLYLNDGMGGFYDAAGLSPGLGDDALANMGVSVADVDLDGDFDLYMSDRTTPDGACNPLYLNNGDGTFADDSALAAGIVADNSWATVFFDADLDGDEDLFVGTTTTAVSDENYFYVNQGDGTFTDETAAVGLKVSGATRGGAVADYDGDGDLDLAYVDQGGALRLFRNDSIFLGHWLKVALVGQWSNRSAVGALVTVRVGEQTQMRQLLGGSGAHSQNSLVAHFGLDQDDVVDEVTIHWPSGAITRLHDVAADQMLTVEERFVVSPDRVTLKRGEGLYGPRANLDASDDRYVSIPAVRRDRTVVATVDVQVTAPAAPHASVSLTVETGAERRVAQEIRAFDAVLDQWVLVDTRACPVDDVALTLDLDPARFVGPGQQVRVRLHWSAPIGSRFDARMDHVEFTFER